MINENVKWNKMSEIVAAYTSEFNPLIPQSTHKLSIARWVSENFYTFLLQYMGLIFTTLTPKFFPLWLASGTACGFVFLRGSAVLPGVWLGSFAAYQLAGFNFLAVIESATVLTLQAEAIYWICHRYVSPSVIFYNPKFLIKFSVFGTLIAGITSLLLLAILRAVVHGSAINWLQWFLANLNGILILSISLATWDAFFSQIRVLTFLNKENLYYGFLMIPIFLLSIDQSPIMICISCLIVFGLIITYSTYFGWCGCALSLVIFSAMLLIHIYMTVENTIFKTITLQFTLYLSTLGGFYIGAKKLQKELK